MKSLRENFSQIIKNAPWFETLATMSELKLNDCWLAGGAIRNTVWKSIFPGTCRLKIKDLDIVFFEPDSDRERELRLKEILSQKHPDWVFDVKNQASFGLWRTWHFKFTSSADGIAHFLHTATAVGVRLNEGAELEILAPYGLEDLFSGTIRCTPWTAGSKSAVLKQQEYLSLCPDLQVADSSALPCP